MKRIFIAAIVLLTAARADAQLMSHDREATLRRFFPKVDDAELTKILAGKLLLWDDIVMPPCYQKWDGLNGVHDVMYNISGDAAEAAKGHGRGGNMNREFPWKSPGGTDNCPNVVTFKFLHLPPRQDGTVWPVVWFRRQLSTDPNLGFAWVFPTGSVVGELLYMKGPNRVDYTFEIRTRTKVVGQWVPDAFRPYPTLDSLVARIKELRPNWQTDSRLAANMMTMTNRSTIRVTGYLGDDNHVKHPAFRQRASIDTLPDLGDQKLVADLLTKTTFKSALGEDWRADYQGPNVFAPTTKAPFHIVPKNYTAGFIDVSQTSCNRCHESANKPADFFEDVFTGRQWYGRGRGSDRIISFYPFSLASISHTGGSQPVSIRQSLVSAGIVAHYDPRHHPKTTYHMIGAE